MTAFFSTCVIPEGTPTTIFGLDIFRSVLAAFKKYLIIALATSKSAMTPSFKGLIALMLGGVLPIYSFASLPTAMTLPELLSMATTEG